MNITITRVLMAYAFLTGQPVVTTMAADNASPGQLSATDYKFVCKAAKDGMMEVEMGKLGEEKGDAQKVKDVGQKMVADHEKANAELKQLASQKGATLPSLPETNSKASQHLGTLSGPEFDRAYLRHMAADHKADIKEFKLEAANGDDADLKNWAATTLPTLESHLRMIENAQGRSYESTAQPSANVVTGASAGIVNESNGNSKNNADSPTSGNSQASTNLPGADASAGIVSPSNGNSKNNADTDAASTNK